MNLPIKLNQFLCKKCKKKFYVNVDNYSKELTCPFCNAPVEKVRIFDMEIKEIEHLNNKLQKRNLEVIELEDGSYLFKGEGWNIETPPEESEEFFSAWRTEKIKEK